MALLLVRHADAGERDAWNAPDRLRPLDGHGFAQAESLVDLLAGFPIAQVLSSPYLRCTQTVEPLARARGLSVERCDDLAEGNGCDSLEVVRRLAGAPVVLCTHGDVIGDVLSAMPAPGQAPMKKGSVWVLDAEDGRYVGARYLPAPD